MTVPLIPVFVGFDSATIFPVSVKKYINISIISINKSIKADSSDTVVWVISSSEFGSSLDYDSFEVKFLLFKLIIILLLTI